MPGLALAHFFSAAMVKADIGHGVDDFLAIELQYDAKDAMHARVVRSQIEKHEVGTIVRAPHSPLFRMKAQRLLLGVLLVLRQAERLHLGSACRMILLQWMACPGGREQDSAQVRVASEDDAEHVPYFALVPIRCRPDVGNGWQLRVSGG